MKASKENVDKCVSLIDDTLTNFHLAYAVGDVQATTHRLMTEALLGCKEMIQALQAKVEELENQ